MKAPAKGACLLALGLFVASVERPARAADRPLLVVVEAPPALDADAGEIRHAIGAELGVETVAPMKMSVDPSERALIVALDRGRIAMSLRTNDAPPVARSIPAPPDHAARLRAIAWLAGNLARDQVSPLVAQAPAEVSRLQAMPTLARPPEVVQPPPLPSAPDAQTEPPPLAETATLTTHSQPTTPSPQHWSIGIADGPTSNFPLCPEVSPFTKRWSIFCAPLQSYGTAWRLELQRRPAGSGFFFGAAVEGTAESLFGSPLNSEFAPQMIGATAFIGSSRRHGRWSLESSSGAGLELANVQATSITSMESSVNGDTSSATTTNSLRPALFLDGALAATHPVWDSLDVVFRVGAHLSTVDLTAWFLSGTIGLRYDLP